MSTVSDFEALRNYVLAADGVGPVRGPAGSVRLEVTHSVLSDTALGTMRFINFALSSSVATIKERLHFVVGTRPGHMLLQLRQKGGGVCASLDNDDALLGQYAPLDGMVLHCTDVDPNCSVAKLQDVSSVQKYVMDSDEYKARAGTVGHYKVQMEQRGLDWRTGRPLEKPGTTTDAPEDDSLPAGIHVGDRCEIAHSERLPEGSRGAVAFVGKLAGKKGYWVGVRLDEPVGANDGSADGTQYFSCPSKYGVFLRPDKVAVGDYPELDIFADDDLEA